MAPPLPILFASAVGRGLATILWAYCASSSKKRLKYPESSSRSKNRDAAAPTNTFSQSEATTSLLSEATRSKPPPHVTMSFAGVSLSTKTTSSPSLRRGSSRARRHLLGPPGGRSRNHRRRSRCPNRLARYLSLCRPEPRRYRDLPPGSCRLLEDAVRCRPGPNPCPPRPGDCHFHPSRRARRSRLDPRGCRARWCPSKCRDRDRLSWLSPGPPRLPPTGLGS